MKLPMTSVTCGTNHLLQPFQGCGSEPSRTQGSAPTRNPGLKACYPFGMDLKMSKLQPALKCIPENAQEAEVAGWQNERSRSPLPRRLHQLKLNR